MIYDKKHNYREICQWVDCLGYKQCNLYKDGKKYYKRIHRIVAQTYIKNPNNLPQVNHKDGNKINNNINNLEWVSNSENIKHSYKNIRHWFRNKKFIIEVYKKSNNEFIGEYSSIRSLSNDLNINRKTLSRILYGLKVNNYPYNFDYIEEG